LNDGGDIAEHRGKNVMISVAFRNMRYARNPLTLSVALFIVRRQKGKSGDDTMAQESLCKVYFGVSFFHLSYERGLL